MVFLVAPSTVMEQSWRNPRVFTAQHLYKSLKNMRVLVAREGIKGRPYLEEFKDIFETP
jgi:hypothetical protein